MKIDAAYGIDIDDDLLNQLMYLECDANAAYEQVDAPEGTFIIGAIPSTTLKQYQSRYKNVLFLMKTKKTKGRAKLLGMACMSKFGKKNICFHTLYVRPLYRNKGIGKALLKKGMQIAKKMGIRMYLNVNPLNKLALDLYEKMGMKITQKQTIEMELMPDEKVSKSKRK